MGWAPCAASSSPTGSTAPTESRSSGDSFLQLGALSFESTAPNLFDVGSEPPPHRQEPARPVAEAAAAEPAAGALGGRVDRALRAAGTRISFLCEQDGTIAWVSDTVRRLLGHQPRDLVGTHFQDLYAEEDREYSERGFATVRANRHLDPEEFGFIPRTARVRHADGRLVTVESHATPCLHDPAIDGVLMEWNLITDRRLLRRAIDAVARNRPLPETQIAIVDLVESLVPGIEAEVLASRDGVWAPIGDPRRRKLDEVLTALPDAADPALADVWLSLDGEPRARQWAGSDRQVGLLPARGADGDLLGALIVVGQRLDGVALMVRTVHDNLLTVAFRMFVLALTFDRSRTKLTQAAHRDPLTNLLNRAGLDFHVAGLLAGAPGTIGVLAIDLDDFKPVNDTFGHAAGDEVLQQVAERIGRTLRGHDIAARTGGDEFVVVCPAISTFDDLTAVADRIQRLIAEPYAVSGATARIGSSVGGAVGLPLELPDLLNSADRVLYEVKRSGKNAVRCAAADEGGRSAYLAEATADRLGGGS